MRWTILIMFCALALQALELPELAVPTMEYEEISSPQIPIDNLDLPENSAKEETTKLIKSLDVAEVAYTKTRDQRNLEYALGGEYIADWLAIYEEYQDIVIEYVAPDSDMRMVAEVSLPANQTELGNINRRLNHYKNRGFNSVLLSFDTTEDIAELKKFIRQLKNHCGFDVYCAFGGSEDLKQTIYVDPVKYKKLLETVSTESKGFLLGWRRTSLHLLLPDAGWTNFHLSTLRNANPNLIILGEVYYGMTAKNHPEIYIEHNIPANISGVIVFNYGYDGINQEYLISKYLPSKIPALKGVNMVGVVIDGNQTRIAERFQKGGSTGTITCIDKKVQPKPINN